MLIFLKDSTGENRNDTTLLADAPASLLVAAVAAGPVAARGEATGAVGPARPPFDKEEDQQDIREKAGSASDDAVAIASGAFNNLAQA